MKETSTISSNNGTSTSTQNKNFNVLLLPQTSPNTSDSTSTTTASQRMILVTFFFYTSNLQGLTIQQYKIKKILKYKYKTRLKPWGNLIRFSTGSVHAENT